MNNRHITVIIYSGFILHLWLWLPTGGIDSFLRTIPDEGENRNKETKFMSFSLSEITRCIC